MKTIRIFLVLFLFTGLTAGAQTLMHTLSGTVTDRESGEPLIAATVMDTRSGKGTVTNAYGHFSLTIKEDSVSLRISYVGYTRWDSLFYLSRNVMLNRALKPSVQLKGMTVRAEKVSNVKSSQISAIDVPLENIKAIPVLFGETDILKAIQLLPGVQSGIEGMNGVYVRGGGPDENLFLLDGVPLYNVNHLGGFFSAFNAAAVKNVTLYKGSFPAHFGGRLSSVLDITTNNGNDKEFHGEATIGLVATSVALEGPIIKEKTTFSISARRTYADLLMQPLLRVATLFEDEKITSGYYFYDLTTKVTHKFNDRSRLFASYYMGDDVVYFKVKTKDFLSFGDNYKYWMKMRYHWGNLLGALRWNYELKPKLFMNLSTSYTRYRNNIYMGIEEQSQDAIRDEIYNVDMSYKSGIRDFCVKADFDYAPRPEHAVKFGTSYTHHLFTPVIMGLKEDESYIKLDEKNGTYSTHTDTTLGESKVHAEEINAFIEDDWSITDVLKVNFGLHLSGFSVERKFYPSLQPRLSGRWLLSDRFSFKAGYAYMTQYMHLLSNSSINLPTDLWVPVTAYVEPMKAHQVAAGCCYNWAEIADFTLEGYYKKMHNLLEYKDGSSFWTSSVNWEDKVAVGDGWSYGVEFLAQRDIGKLTGWIGYTWSRTMRQFDRKGMEINNGKPFPAKYDRRHDLSIVLSYKPNERMDFSMTWVFCTGNAATLPMQEFQSDEYEEYFEDDALKYVEGRNNFRMPAYHRMDIGINFHKQLKRCTRTISWSVYNLYNRKNPFLVYESGTHHYSYQGTTYSSALVQLSLFPIIPSVSCTYKF